MNTAPTAASVAVLKLPNRQSNHKEKICLQELIFLAVDVNQK